jgi:hypothetical protein
LLFEGGTLFHLQMLHPYWKKKHFRAYNAPPSGALVAKWYLKLMFYSKYYSPIKDREECFIDADRFSSVHGLILRASSSSIML